MVYVICQIFRWSTVEIKRLENLSIHPCAPVINYGTSVFEGMKAKWNKSSSKVSKMCKRSCMHLFANAKTIKHYSSNTTYVATSLTSIRLECYLIFRPNENLKRLQHSCDCIALPKVSLGRNVSEPF